jgi:hypothetical protein
MVVALSKINDIVGTDDLLPDEKKKLEKQFWLRSQVDFKIMVKVEKDEDWSDFTGLFLMKDGWNKEKVTEHIQNNFSTDQFRVYTFGLFKRYYKDTTNNINNNFTFDLEHNIPLLEEVTLIDEEDVW